MINKSISLYEPLKEIPDPNKLVWCIINYSYVTGRYWEDYDPDLGELLDGGYIYQYHNHAQHNLNVFLSLFK